MAANTSVIRIFALGCLAVSCTSAAPPPEVKLETVMIPGTTLKFDLARVPASEGIPEFWIGKTEVGFKRFNFYFNDRALIGKDGRTNPSEAGGSFMVAKIPKRQQRDESPMTNLRWTSAVSYCDWLSRNTGHYYRLPTESEWEFAARAGDASAAPKNLDEVAWHEGNCDGETHLGGESKPNAFGIHDMLGNAWEYCLEQDPPPHFKPVLRGGSYNQAKDKISYSTRTAVIAPWFEGDPNRPRSTWFLSGAYSQGMRIVRVAGAEDAEARGAYSKKLEVKVAAGEEHVHKTEKAVDFYRHVTGTVKNTGDRPLSEVEILVYYLDGDGGIHVIDRQPSAGKPGRATWGKCWPVLGSASKDAAARAVLKPGETRSFAADLPLSFDEEPDVDPEAFGGHVTNVRFADGK